MGSGGPSLLRAPPPARGLGATCPPPGPPSTQTAADTPEPSACRSRPTGLGGMSERDRSNSCEKPQLLRLRTVPGLLLGQGVPSGA